MNRLHQWLCRSDRWRATVRERVPWVLDGTDLGPKVLEHGPGPGLTADLLRMGVRRLTALEVDPNLANALTSRLRESNVEVIEGNATANAVCGLRIFGSRVVHYVSSCPISRTSRPSSS